MSTRAVRPGACWPSPLLGSCPSSKQAAHRTGDREGESRPPSPQGRGCVAQRGWLAPIPYPHSYSTQERGWRTSLTLPCQPTPLS